MRILFTVLLLDGFHGSVMHVKEMASFLASAKGGHHSVTVATCFATPSLVKIFNDANITVKKIFDIDTKIKYDIVFAYHFPVIDALFNQGLSCDKLVLGSLSSFELMETFPTYWDNASLLTVMSEETRHVHHTHYAIPLEKMHILENFIPDIYADYVSTTRHPLKKPKSIIVVSNHVPEELYKRMSGIHLAIPVFSKGYRPKQGKVAP